MLEFQVLGPLETHTARGVSVPPGPKVRKVLALLLLRANQVVSVDTLAEELWDEHPPRTTVTTVRTHVYHLRGILEQAGAQAASALLTQPSGYLLALRPGQLDVDVFTDLVNRGRTALAQGDPATAAALLRTALDCCRGPSLANVSAGRVLSRYVAHLDELRARALELRITADMRLGGHRELVAELRGLVAGDPLNEWAHARLIDCLRLSGQRGAALAAYGDLRRVLDAELGLEPSAEVRRLQFEILSTVPLSAAS
jgi:DNA-binding SARP family transcriptional activator